MSDAYKASDVLHAGWHLMAKGFGTTASDLAVQARTTQIGGTDATALLVSNLGAGGAGGGEVDQGSRGTGAASAQAWFVSDVVLSELTSATAGTNFAFVSDIGAGGAGGTDIQIVSPTTGANSAVLVHNENSTVHAVQSGAWNITSATVNQGAAGAAGWPVVQSGAWNITSATVNQGAAGAAGWPVVQSGAWNITSATVNQGAAGAAAWPVSVSGTAIVSGTVTGSVAATAQVTNTVTVTGSVAATVTGSVQAVGNVAHDAADAGNPLKIGGFAASSLPAQVAQADRVNALFDLRGRQLGGAWYPGPGRHSAFQITSNATTASLVSTLFASSARSAAAQALAIEGIVWDNMMSSVDGSVNLFVGVSTDTSNIRFRKGMGCGGGGVAHQFRKGLTAASNSDVIVSIVNADQTGYNLNFEFDVFAV